MKNRDMLPLKDYLGNLNVSVAEYGYQKVWTDWRDIDYTPNYNKFYFICSGEGYLRIGNSEYYPTPGQLFLMPAGVKQSYSAINENTFTKYWCHFSAKIGEMNLFDIISLPHFIEVMDRSIPEGLFKELIKSCESQEFYSILRIKAGILGLITYYLENSTVDKINISSSQTVENLNLIVDYIDNHLDENITVEKLAKIIHLHPNYFIRSFKRVFGTPPMNYIINRRIEEAKMMIKTTDLTLSIIGDRIGIKDIYYLSKLFKEHTGFSPTEYRKVSRVQ